MTSSEASKIKSRLNSLNIKGFTKEQKEEITKMIIEALKTLDK